MRLIALIITALFSSCAISETINKKDIHNNLIPYITKEAECLENFDDPEFPVIDDNRLISIHEMDDGRKLILALCQPGGYQDYYIAFITPNLESKDIRPLQFLLPSSEGINWSLSKRAVVANPHIENNTLVIFNKYTGSAACGFEAKFNISTIGTNILNKPADLKGELDCQVERGPDDWPKIKLD